MIANSLDREYILNELRALKSELRDRYKVSKIGIFGSVSRNGATEGRGIGIVVEIEPNMLTRRFFSLSQVEFVKAIRDHKSETSGGLSPKGLKEVESVYQQYAILM